MQCVKKPGNAISETSKRFQSWSCVHGGFGCIKPRQKTCSHGRHTATTRMEGTQKISTQGQHTENTHTRTAHYTKHGRKAQKTLMDRRHTENMHEGTYGRHIYNIQTEDAHKTRTRGRHTENLHARTAYSTLDIFHCLGNNGSYQLRAVKIRFDIIHCKKAKNATIRCRLANTAANQQKTAAIRCSLYTLCMSKIIL